MNDTGNNSDAMQAIDEYLDGLLDDDSPMACEEKKAASAPLSGSKLYHIESHPLHKRKDTVDKRRNLERVERLLDDFNNRNPNADEEPELNVKPYVVEDSEELNPVQFTDVQLKETKVLIEPSLLQPEIPSEEVLEDETIADNSDIVEREVILSTELYPESLPIEREDWSQQPFQTLLFDVAGLTLAVPLVKLGGIYKIEQKPTTLFGKPEWFIGLVPGHDGNINVVDTARWVMPEKYQQAQDAGLNYEFLILLDDSNWGLACSNVQNAITLSPEDIRWRPKAGKRPWLDGMIIDEMCALLNVDTLIHLLEENFPR